MPLEVIVMNGKGQIEITGSLGDVMKESCQAAVTYIRSRTSELGIDPAFHKNTDIHLLFPEGAVADRQHLVEYKYLRVDHAGDGECYARLHAA